MGLSFHESMQGNLVDRFGRTRPIDFRVKGEASHLGAFARDGRARITGIIHAPPYADRAPLDGTMTIRPLPLQGQFIRYEFSFQGEGERVYTFFGEKHLSVLRPVASVSSMQGEVRCDGERVAHGEIRFDMNDVFAFGASAAPDSAFNGLCLDVVAPAGGIPARQLGKREQELLVAFADAVIEPGVHVPPADALTVEKAQEILAHMPPGTATAFAAVLRALDLLARGRYGAAFDAITRDRRVAMIETIDDIRGPDAGAGALSPHAILHLVGMPVRAAHFDRADFLANIGAPTYVNKVREADPEWTQRIVTPEDLPEESRLDCDVVVVGTGAGGAAIAAKLAEKGLAVAIIEEGRYMSRREFTGSPIDRMRKLWRNAGLTFSVGNPPISLPLGRMVGGTTAINSGTCFRAPEHVFADWRRDVGLGDEFSADAFDDLYARVEEELQVTPASPHHLGSIADIVKKGADAMGLAHAPLPRNAPGCDGQGQCVVGCPTDAKRSTNVSWVPRAVNAGAGLYTGLPMTRILQRGRQIVAIECRGPDKHGAPKLLRVHARAFVLACGALVTPHVLLQNGFDLPMLGRNLSVHPEVGMWTRVDRPTAPWAAIPQSYGVHGLESEGIKFEGYYVPPQIAGSTIPLLGKELTRWMDAFGHCAQFGFLVKDPGSGAVSRGPDGKPFVTYDLADDTHAKLRRGAALLAEMLIRGGGLEVMTGIRGVGPVADLDGARAIASMNIRKLDWNLLGSHPLGTCRIGSSPKVAVCDPDHRVFGTENLYIADGSSVPTSLGVNPQMTIMALALRAGEGIASRLS